MKKGAKHSKEAIAKIKLARKKQVGDKHPCWKGGKILRSGYIYIKVYNHPMSGKQGYYAEHRLIFEKHIGRYLKKEEVVHHKNGIITDNRLCNLELFETKGQHTKLAHPEIIERTKKLNKGKHFSPKTEFKKGQIPWNKGIPMSKKAKQKLINSLANKNN